MSESEEISGDYISAHEVANYVVCPEAWRLKSANKTRPRETKRLTEGRQLRKEWVAESFLYHQLKTYGKTVYLLLVALVISVFLFEAKFGKGLHGTDDTPKHFPGFTDLTQFLDIPGQAVFTQICLLLVVLGAVIFMWDFFDRHSRAASKSAGLDMKTELIALQGTTALPSRTFSSPSLRLTSKPNALAKDKGFIIPIDVLPMSKKVKDRHVVQLLSHMRLIEEAEGKAPPYGALLMGKDRRFVKIKNTPEKQRWLESLLDEMRSIQEGIPAVPAPTLYKCKSCDVRELCAHTAYKPRAPDQNEPSLPTNIDQAEEED